MLAEHTLPSAQQGSTSKPLSKELLEHCQHLCLTKNQRSGDTKGQQFNDHSIWRSEFRQEKWGQTRPLCRSGMTYLSWHRQRKSGRTWGSWWNSRVFASISLIQNTFRCQLLLKAFQFSPNSKWYSVSPSSCPFCKLLFLQLYSFNEFLFPTRQQRQGQYFVTISQHLVWCSGTEGSLQVLYQWGLMISWVSTLWTKELVEREGLQG